MRGCVDGGRERRAAATPTELMASLAQLHDQRRQHVELLLFGKLIDPRGEVIEALEIALHDCGTPD